MKNIKGLARLSTLSLNNTRVTGAGLQHLEGLTHLQMLDLDSSQVTDVGVEHLKAITGLKTLHISDMQPESQTLRAKVHKVLPNCLVTPDPTIPDGF